MPQRIPRSILTRRSQPVSTPNIDFSIEGCATVGESADGFLTRPAAYASQDVTKITARSSMLIYE
jgi:hypothetical protein